MSKSRVISDVLNFLKRNKVAVLATAYRNLPYASAVYYIVDAKLNFYFATSMNTDKYFNLKINKNVALVIGAGPKHISVQVRGHATVLKNKKQSSRILNDITSALGKKRVENWPIKKIKNMQTKKKTGSDEVVYKVIPQHLVFINLDNQSFKDSVSNKFHTIIPLPKK